MLVLFTGAQGGVGTSTAAASLALACAQRGRRCLVVGMQGDAHLPLALGLAAGGPGLHEVGPGLELLVVDPARSWQARAPQLGAWIQGALAGFGLQEPGPELSLGPGAQELAAWLEVAAAEAAQAHDLVILDGGSGPGALRLAALPAWAAQQASWAEPLLPRLGAAWAMLAPFLGSQVAAPSAGVLQELEGLWRLLKGLPEALTRPERAVARLVASAQAPEEALRAHLVALGMAGWHVDALLQAEGAPSEAQVALAAPALWRALPPGLGASVGLAMHWASQLWPEAEPWRALEAGPEVAWQPEPEGGWSWRWRCPGISSKGLSLAKRGPTVYLTVGQQRRAFLLPEALQGASVTKAKCAGGCLTIRFAPA